MKALIKGNSHDNQVYLFFSLKILESIYYFLWILYLYFSKFFGKANSCRKLAVMVISQAKMYSFYPKVFFVFFKTVQCFRLQIKANCDKMTINDFGLQRVHHNIKIPHSERC